MRIAPGEIRKKGRVPKNGSVFFTIFQTFMSGTDGTGRSDPYFGDYPPDFFDFIVIDECHRGGANDESNWRAIMDYFSPAVQLGLTATPKRDKNVDTYDYFGDPVYIYTSDDDIIEGEVEEGRIYESSEFNVPIEIQERKKIRVEIFMREIDQSQKMLVFCATQAHALLVRDLINQAKSSSDPNYCVRVTANDGNEGERFLRIFQDNEKTIPTILTTSQKLSTGVDVRNIVLLRHINSMIKFKQIVGRGTRLFDGKDYFTVYDYVDAYRHFNDPEWDGEPLEPESCPVGSEHPCVCERTPSGPCSICGQRPCVCENPPPEPCSVCGEWSCVCGNRRTVKIKLADGKERTIQHMIATSFWSPDGKPISSAQFIEQLFGELPSFFKDEDEIRKLWSRPDTRQRLLDGLEEKGYGQEQLIDLSRMIHAEKSDLYDVLSYIAYAQLPISREERVETHRKLIFMHYADKQQEFLDFILEHYIQQGVDELAENKLPNLIELKYHAVRDAVAELGSIADIRELFIGFQSYLYEKEAVA